MDRHPALTDARESLDYWERRLASLPRRDKRGRREATEHVERWRERVNAEERRAYGQGPAGMLAQVAAEGRLPAPLQARARRLARTGKTTAKVVVYTTVGFGVLVLVAVIALIVAIL